MWWKNNLNIIEWHFTNGSQTKPGVKGDVISTKNMNFCWDFMQCWTHGRVWTFRLSHCIWKGCCISNRGLTPDRETGSSGKSRVRLMHKVQDGNSPTSACWKKWEGKIRKRWQRFLIEITSHMQVFKTPETHRAITGSSSKCWAKYNDLTTLGQVYWP